MHRRTFLATGAAAAALPAWAGMGIRYLAAANTPANETFLLGLTALGAVACQLPLPARGHAAAAHPHRAEAVAFARRPGNFAVVLDCGQGREIARLTAPDGRHFYGHGAFSADGSYLLTTENDFDHTEGRIGVWDAAHGYRRIDELASGGIGPHELICLPGGGFAVANGGIATHPARARAKLNLPTMQTSLVWLDPAGQIVAQITAPPPMRQNSIRHIAAGQAAEVIAALQWQGAPMARVPLLARIRPNGIEYIDHEETRDLHQYAGSIAVSRDGRMIALTGPKGDKVLYFDQATGRSAGSATFGEVSGAAAFGPNHFALTSSEGLVVGGTSDQAVYPVAGNWRFDNHLVSVATPS